MPQLLDLLMNEPDPGEFLDRNLPEGLFRKIMLKPNWVKHQELAQFPIEALVTSSEMIDQVIQACLRKYPRLEKITVGDVPLQSCEWEKLIRQAGVDRLMKKYEGHASARIEFLDLRKERWRERDGFLARDPEHEGDPAGYAEVVLDERSLLEPVSDRASLFRVSDYDPEEMASVHGRGQHRYLIARSVLEADLFINLPKMKTHQKAGITGALKNLVGINGSKAYLVHHRKGFPSRGGDEFPETASKLFYYQARFREQLQKRSRFLFSCVRPVWRAIKRIRGIQTVGTPDKLNSNFYMGSGSWWGNDSIWRMVYDLNMIILFAAKEGGPLRPVLQRQYVAFLDGIISGEGNGPLQPLPVCSNVLAASENPFLIDLAMSKMMGFDYRKMPFLANMSQFPYQGWGGVCPEQFTVRKNGMTAEGGLKSVPVLRPYLSSPGWKGHIEAET
jgi:hypothetical protein